MKKKILYLVNSLIACCAIVSSISWADGPGDQHWQQHGGNQHQGHGNGGHGHGNNQAPHNGNDSYAGHPMPQDHHGGDHFALNGQDFRRGYPAPPQFLGPNYRIDDWRAFGLYPPPHGEYWVDIDGNYILVAAATGIITSILLDNAFH